MSELAVSSFDYTVIEDKDVKGKLINLEGRIRKQYASMADSVLKIGEELATAQAVLANHDKGVFGKWIQQACGFSERTAYNYINAFTRFGDGSATVAKLEDTAMYVLAAPSTPEKAVTEAKKLADKGVQVTAKVAKELIAKHKENGHAKVEPEDCSKGHKWASDGNGERYCERCKEDHPDNPQPLKDAFGFVSESLKEIFEQVPSWKNAMECVSQAKKAITGLKDHPAAAWLDVSETERLLSQARTNLKFAMPYTECPKCRRKPKKDCTHCKGTGWLNEPTFKACVSEADKAWLENRK